MRGRTRSRRKRRWTGTTRQRIRRRKGDENEPGGLAEYNWWP